MQFDDTGTTFPQPPEPAHALGLGPLGTAAHQQHQTIRLTRTYPEHDPRTDDPNYHLFEQAKARIKAQGLWQCAINNADCAGQLQLHHAYIEFAYQNSVDIGALDAHLGLHLDDATFAAWVEGPANLEVLCQGHHTGVLGAHLIPVADWEIVRVHLSGVKPVVVDQGPAAG